MRNPKPITKEYLTEIVNDSTSIAECLRKMGMAQTACSYNTFRERVRNWEINIEHFVKRHYTKQIPLDSVLCANSHYTRKSLKQRLLKTGLKNNICEMCGQGENWHGKKMHLILDHINGIRDDNRLENLRIICPNCDATLDTFGNKKCIHTKNKCHSCGMETKNNKYCSRKCAQKVSLVENPIFSSKIERPPLEILLKEIQECGYCGTGRKYGVSDNTVRKWLKKI